MGKYEIPKLKILMWRLEYLQSSINKIEKILYSEMNKENSLELIRKLFKGIHRATESENYGNNRS